MWEAVSDGRPQSEVAESASHTVLGVRFSILRQLLAPPRIRADLVLRFEHAAKIARTGKPTLAGNHVQRLTGVDEQLQRALQPQLRQRLLRRFLPGLPEQPAQMPAER